MSDLELTETHSAVVLFVGPRAYKFKKAIDLGFLDFSTLDARRVACEREVALNRRLAPDVYLGVATVNDPDGSPCEHLVVMKRMPSDRRLTACIARGLDVADDLRRVAHILAALHEASPAAGVFERVGTAHAVRKVWDDGFRQMEPHVGSVLPAATAQQVEMLVHRYLDGREPLFSRRIADGWIRDGHGDLQADDIFLLPDGPRVLDCIEFSDELRWGDALGDIAFLAMDLERLGEPDLARRFLAWHREFTGDTWPESLADHYIAQRACVRAKVTAIRSAQGDPDAAGEARRFLELARDHLQRGRVTLTLVGGLPGTGKSTVAASIAEQRPAVVVRSDELRPRPAKYGADDVAANYGEVLRRAETLLRLGESVVLDATWASGSMRERARDIAKRSTSDLVELVCRAPDDVARARIEERGRAGRDPSEATPAVATAMAARFDPWPSAIVIDTNRSPEACAAGALAAIDLALGGDQ